MFEIGFTELMLVGIVALLVFGPDKLPGLARNVGLWIGRFRRLVSTVQSDINREFGKAEELQRLLEEQKEIVERHEFFEDTKPTVPVVGKPVPPPANLTASNTGLNTTVSPVSENVAASSPAVAPIPSTEHDITQKAP